MLKRSGVIQNPERIILFMGVCVIMIGGCWLVINLGKETGGWNG